MALAERSASWTSAGLTVVKELMKGHAASAAGKFRTESEKRSIAAGELEREEFSLMLKMFECLECCSKLVSLWLSFASAHSLLGPLQRTAIIVGSLETGGISQQTPGKLPVEPGYALRSALHGQS